MAEAATTNLAVAAIQEYRLVIAIDYGTTYTGIAYATPSGSESDLHQIDVVTDWGNQMGVHDKIPSVISYTPASPAGEQQWGSSLSQNAVAMVNTKLKLDIHDVSEELDMIIQALDGMKNLEFHYIARNGLPDFSWKGAEDIVADYLERVYTYLMEAVDKFSEELRIRIPVDIVLTVPTEWSYDAINSTYRALTAAGFNRETFPRLADTILVTEPEAAAIYTARHLREVMGRDFLKVGECFVLCDAGGGTVDVVSYKVKQLQPNLELESVGLPSGAKCGSVYIDLAFKNWLRGLVGDEYYRQLDPTFEGNKISSYAVEGEYMRELMKTFDGFKKRFKRDHRDMRMDLPGPLANLDLDTRVQGGEITITNDDMKSFFDPQLDQIVALIQGHLFQITELKKRILNIFLIGGFAESSYLQEELGASMRMRQITLRRPDTSWTAVVRGAVIYGTEKSRVQNLQKLTAAAKNYGLCLKELASDINHRSQDQVRDPITNHAVAVGQMKWLIKRGDALLSTDPRVNYAVFDFTFTATGPREVVIPIYCYEDEDNLPDRFDTAQDELAVVHTLRYDLSGVPLETFGRSRDPSVLSRSKSALYYTAKLKVQLSLHKGVLRPALFFKNNELVGAEIRV